MHIIPTALCSDRSYSRGAPLAVLAEQEDMVKKPDEWRVGPTFPNCLLVQKLSKEASMTSVLAHNQKAGATWGSGGEA